MNFPVGAEDVKIVQGHSGRGIQVVCSCGCVNMNYLEDMEATWRCRNCQRVFSYNFPALVEKVLAREKAGTTATAGGASS